MQLDLVFRKKKGSERPLPGLEPLSRLKIGWVIDPFQPDHEGKATLRAISTGRMWSKFGFFPPFVHAVLQPLQMPGRKSWFGGASVVSGFDADVERLFRFRKRKIGSLEPVAPFHQHCKLVLEEPKLLAPPSSSVFDCVNEICSYAKAAGIDVLVINARRKSRFWDFFSPDLAVALASRCKIPVLIMNGKNAPSVSGEEVLFPATHPERERAFEAFEGAIRFCRIMQKKLVILYKAIDIPKPEVLIQGEAKEVAFYSPPDLEKQYARMNTLFAWVAAAKEKSVAVELHVDKGSLGLTQSILDFSAKRPSVGLVMIEPSYFQSYSYGFSVQQLSMESSRPVWIAHPLTTSYSLIRRHSGSGHSIRWRNGNVRIRN